LKICEMSWIPAFAGMTEREAMSTLDLGRE
jgi:hypothetical protein